MYKVIYIDQIPQHYKNIPSDIEAGDNYFTYGWAGICSRKFKEFNPDLKVECWKTDRKAKKINEREISGVYFRIFPAFNIKYLGDYSRLLIRSLKNELKKKEPAIIHITSFRHLLFYSLALKFKTYPIVVQNNGEATALYKYKISKGLKKLFYLLQIPIEKISLNNIDLLYILDERIKAYLPPTSSIVKKQTLGIMPERFTPLNKREARQLLNLNLGKKYLLYVGRLNYTKRPDILLEVYKDIKNERDDIELIIVGTNDEDLLINAAKEAGAKVYGIIMQTEIHKYLSAADVYILPKYSSEHIFGGIGLLPLEALLCNTPVIGRSLENFPDEYINDVGFAVSEKNQIKKAIYDIVDRIVTFNKLRETAMMFYSWEKIIDKTANDFKLLDEKYYNQSIGTEAS